MSKSGVAPDAVLPSPVKLLDALREEINDGRLAASLSASAGRLIVGYLIGASIGALLGLVFGMVWVARSALFPLVEILRPIPPLAWVPLALIWFGIGESSKIFLIALRSEEHTSELQSLMRISYAVFCLKKKKKDQTLISSHH